MWLVQTGEAKVVEASTVLAMSALVPGKVSYDSD